jgi:hypothetical protein
VAGTFECGNETWGSIKFGEFLDWLQNRFASQEGLCSMEYVGVGLYRFGSGWQQTHSAERCFLESLYSRPHSQTNLSILHSPFRAL